MTSDPFDHSAEHLAIGQPHELPTVLAYLLGYHPAPGSVAFLGLHDYRIALTANIDGSHTSAEDWPATIARTAELFAEHGWEMVLLAYGSVDVVGARAEAMLQAIADHKVPIVVAARVDADRLYCLVCTDCQWHDIDARPTDALLARLVYAGLQAAPDRRTFAQLLAPVDTAAQQRTKAVLEAAAQGRLRRAVTDPHGPVTQIWRDLTRAGTAAVDDAIAAAQHRVALTDEDAAWLLFMLTHLPARDHALLAITESPTIDLWRDLLRRAPTGLQAPPATLLAASALLIGEGHIAAIALQRALDDDPEYRMAHLLAHAMSAGMPASELREAIREAAQDA